MTIEIRVPALGESITEATVGQWLKQRGDAVAIDEPLVELETDKVTVEVPAPATGVLDEIKAETGATVPIGALLGALKEGTVATPPAKRRNVDTGVSPAAPEAVSFAQAPAASDAVAAQADQAKAVKPEMPPSPAARKQLAESGIAAGAVQGTGKRGQVLKHNVEAVTKKGVHGEARSVPSNPVALALPPQQLRLPSAPDDAAREERVRMTRLRQTIARRLKDAQNTAAMLTTVNDVDMSAVMKVRSDYKELFEKRHGVKLGFMGFFVKACLQALKEIPAVNAEIDGEEIVYKNYYHIGVAVGTERGLVVPVVREADRLSLAEIEMRIADFGRRARDGRLGIEDMQGGTFTISNGGVYGSLLSTPILNAPQSGILGMHRIEERPVVRNGKIEARPMMYLALSYDHRLVDGREAVTFLVRVKDYLEDPNRFVLEL